MGNFIKSDEIFNFIGYWLFTKHLVFDLLGLFAFMFIDVIFILMNGNGFVKKSLVDFKRDSPDSSGLFVDDFIYYLIIFMIVLCIVSDVFAMCGICTVGLEPFESIKFFGNFF
jgi:hypothetical protein